MPVLRLIVFALSVMLLSGCETFSPQAPIDGPIVDETRLATADNVIVLVETAEDAASLILKSSRLGYRLRERETLNGLGLFMLDFTRPSGVSGTVAIKDMLTLEPNSTAGVEHFYTLQAANINTGPRTYARDMLAWPEQGCEASLSVGIIDGAVDMAHPLFQDSKIIARDIAKGDVKDSAHGTAIAQLIIGPGRLTNTQFYSASVVRRQAAANGAGVYDLILALDWMQASNVKVVNFSLAGPYNALLDRAVTRATDRGMILVAAVGNDGPSARPLYPAAFKDVIAVTAIDARQDVFADAVRGKHVDFSAPGVDIFITGASTEKRQNGKHPNGKYQSGTSLAATSVTAIIASDAANSKDAALDEVKARLLSSIVDLGVKGHDFTFGNGLPLVPSSCVTNF